MKLLTVLDALTERQGETEAILARVARQPDAVPLKRIDLLDKPSTPRVRCAPDALDAVRTDVVRRLAILDGLAS